MEMPVFALHTVLFPGQAMGLRVFEPRYRALMDDVLPAGTFAVVAILHGQEVGGSYEPHRVGVTVAIEAHDRDEDGSHRLRIVGRDRVALIAPSREDPYPIWQVELFPDEGGAGTDDVEAAADALSAYLSVTGEPARAGRLGPPRPRGRELRARRGNPRPRADASVAAGAGRRG